MNQSYANDAKTQSMSVLIVEDDALVAAYISEVLIEAGFLVAGIASSGNEALSLIAPTTQLALVDIGLAGPMDGIEVARQLMDRHDVGVIFLSGTIDPEVIARAAAVDAHGFLAKPFLPSQVYKALDAAMAARRRQRIRLEAAVDA